MLTTTVVPGSTYMYVVHMCIAVKWAELIKVIFDVDVCHCHCHCHCHIKDHAKG